MKKNVFLEFRNLIIAALMIHLGAVLFAFPRDMIVQNIKGPWELSISLGGQDSGVVFPIKLDDENVRQTLNKLFPVLGSPVQVKVIEYCPNLAWETFVAKDPHGGPTATIAIAADGGQQEVVLMAHVPERRAVTASIGGLAIRQIHHAATDGTLLKKIAEEKAIGLLTLWTDPNAPPQEFVVKSGESFEVPQTSYKVEVLDYMPHYSIDQKTKEVKNYSEQPVNPALKIRLSDGQKNYEQWVWSNFSSSPHAMSKLPIRVEFNDFDFGPSGNRFFIVTAEDSGWWLCYQKAGEIQIEEGKLRHAYAFKDSEYTFTVESIIDRGTLDKKWVNRSEKLEHPALVVSVESDKDAQEALVELNRPTHVKTAYGALILNYRQKTEPKQHGTP